MNEKSSPSRRKRAWDRFLPRGMQSALTRRAVAFTALDFLAAVIIGSPIFHLCQHAGWGKFASVAGLGAFWRAYRCAEG